MIDLPLLELFNKLRDAGIPLGIGEYQMVLQALQAGFGISSRAELARLCCTLWVKSSEEKEIFSYYFNQLIPEEYTSKVSDCTIAKSDNPKQVSGIIWPHKIFQKFPRLKQHLLIGGSLVLLGNLILIIHPLWYKPGNILHQTKQTEITKQPSYSLDWITRPRTKEIVNIEFISILISVIFILFLISLYVLFLFSLSRVDRLKQHRQNKYEVTYKVIPPIPKISLSQVSQTPELIREISDEIQLARAVRQFNNSDRDPLNSIITYLPLTRRQVKQSWRYLRCLVREGIQTELDINATVDQIGHNGIFLDPVLVPRRVNRIQVLLLIDWGGSMIPFHKIAVRFAETALQGGRLGKVGIYYFHNCPLDYLYQNASCIEAEAIDSIFDRFNRSRAVAVVFSDAGTTRGNLNSDRYQSTKIFIERLKRHVKHIVWINPMPQERWLNTTAGEISKIIPMFAANRQGLDSAIDVLRGRPYYQKESNR